MRKMMMVALFSVLSLSACAIQQPEETTDESSAEQEDSPPKGDPKDWPAIQAWERARYNGHEVDDGEAIWLQCDDASECESNVCDLEIHTCREYPF
jgi:hypothetical protein